MARAQPLPESLLKLPFTVYEARELGVSSKRLRAKDLESGGLRLAMVDANLPEPELQLRLDPRDPLSPAADLGYREYRIAVQYDGAHHRSREQQTRDNRRDELFIHAGWFYVKPNADDLADGFRSLVCRIKQARRRHL